MKNTNRKLSQINAVDEIFEAAASEFERPDFMAEDFRLIMSRWVSEKGPEDVVEAEIFYFPKSRAS